MVKVNIETEIHCPPEEVFDCLTDISNYSEWMPRSGLFVKSEQVSPGAPQEGARFYDWTKMGKFQGEIVEFDRPKKVSFRQKLQFFGVTVMESRPSYTLESSDKGPRVHHTGEAELFGPFKVLDFRAKNMAWKERSRTVKALKKKLESDK